MWVLPVCRGALLCLLVSLMLAVHFCYCDCKTVEVVGIGDCEDCDSNKIETSKAFSGLRVTIKCKTTNGVFKTRGVGVVDEERRFKASLPAEMVKEDGELKEECFAQLCSARNGMESSKLVFKSHTNGKYTFGPSGKLKFSRVACTSDFSWPRLTYPPLPTLPPLPKIPSMPGIHPWHKHFPKVYSPPKVCPPKPKTPIRMIPPPPFPIYAPKPPVGRTVPPFPKTPPILKKPCPPLPKIPGFPKIPPISKIPVKNFHRPRFGYFPPISPFSRNP